LAAALILGAAFFWTGANVLINRDVILRSAQALRGTIRDWTLHCSFDRYSAYTKGFPFAPSKLLADVRSLTPASPPFRMTSWMVAVLP
jgi:hypothetical protein